MSLARFALEQTKLAHALFFILSAIGVVAWRNLPIEVYPELRTSSAVIETVWPGAPAEQVEQLLTVKIEGQIEGVRHVAWHRSESTANLSRVVVRFDAAASRSEVNSAFADLQSRVNRIAELPEGCEKPVARSLRQDEDDPFLRLCVSDAADRGPLPVRRFARRLKNALADVPGVSGVQLMGEGQREVRVLLDRPALQDAGLSTVEVAAVLRRSALSVPVGTIASAEQEFPVRFVGDVDELDQLGNVIVRKDPTGAHVYLRDVAKLEEGLGRDFLRARYQGHRCIVVNVTKTSGANIVDVRRQVIGTIDEFREQADAAGVSLDVAVDITDWVSGALSVMMQNLLAGCLLVLIVLGVFLGVRNSVLAMLGIPFSFLCTLTCLWAMGITLNTASVFGLVLLSGLIVDDAIVVLENVYRHMQSGVTRREAIVQGVGEVIGPVSAAAVTTVMAFLPILLVREGILSLFTVVPKVVAVALLASLFECLFILPGHILHWGPRSRSAAAASHGPSVLSKVGGWFSGVYLTGLESLLRLRYLAALAVVAMVVLAVVARTRIPDKLLPAEFPMARVNFESHDRSSLDDTDRLGARLCGVLDDISGDRGVIQNYITVAGMQLNEHQELIRQSNVGMIFVQFHPTETARRDPEEVLTKLRERIEAYRRANSDSGLTAFSISAMGIGVEQAPAIAVRVAHSDMGVCRRVARRLGLKLAEFPGVSEIHDNTREGPLEVNLRPDEPQCSEFGLTSYDVAGTARAAAEGIPAGNFRDADTGEEVPIRVLFADPYRDGLDDLLAIPVKTPTGAEPRLGEVATAYYDQHYASLYHYRGRRLITVSATIEGRPTDAEGRPIDVRYVNRMLAQEFPALEKEYPGASLSLGGGYAQERGAFGDLAVAGVLAAALIYLALLAQFRSYIQPLLVLLTLVFGFLGVVFGLTIHGYPFSVVTAVSLVGLFGVAVNDAILLIDFMNKAPREGQDRTAQVLEGCRLRLRPILVTTITTVAGLFPMALGIFGYSAIWSPFAACFSYGLTAATVLTLLVLPCFYMICDDVGRLWGRLWGRHLAHGDLS